MVLLKENNLDYLNYITVLTEYINMSALKKLIPLADRVLVQKFAAETKTKGGILLPDSSKTKVSKAFGPFMYLCTSLYKLRHDLP